MKDVCIVQHYTQKTKTIPGNGAYRQTAIIMTLYTSKSRSTLDTSYAKDDVYTHHGWI